MKEASVVQVISLQGSYNARGLGASDRPWLVRSAALDQLTTGDEAQLRALGVDLVLDLREPDEAAGVTHGLPVHRAPLYGAAPPRSGALEEVYAGLLRDRGSRLTAAVIAIAEHPGTVAVHCTAGKDRTGLVVALASLAAGRSVSDVVDDYARSGASVRPARAGIAQQQLAALALTPPERAASERLHLDSPTEAIESALALIESLGGVQTYLLERGATPAHLAALRRRAAGADADTDGHTRASGSTDTDTNTSTDTDTDTDTDTSIRTDAEAAA